MISMASVRKTSIKKLHQIIGDAYDFGKLPKGIHLVQFRRLENIVEAIERGERPIFFESEINDLLNKCGVKTEVFGVINWRVC